MDGGSETGSFALGAQALGRVMPMFLLLTPDCRIRAAGPTLLKLMGNGALGRGLQSVFAVRRPRKFANAQDLTQAPRLGMSLRAPPGTGFKGVAVPLQAGGGVLVNLSFGFAVAGAVRDHALSDTDFAPTDLAIELLYLAEANAAVMGEIGRMTLRLRGAKAQAEEQAMSDPLTGLRNRRAMERELAHMIESGGDFALIQLDLDYFKQVNDTLGHAAGDHVLCALAAILRRTVRGGDTVARVGGDEFIILLPGVRSVPPVARIGEKILSQMEAPITFEGQTCRVAVSMGAVLSVCVPQAGAEGILSRADHALYASKRAGRNRMTVYSPGLDGDADATGPPFA